MVTSFTLPGICRSGRCLEYPAARAERQAARLAKDRLPSRQAHGISTQGSCAGAGGSREEVKKNMMRHRKVYLGSLVVLSALALAACSGGSDVMDGKGQVRIVMSSGAGAVTTSTPASGELGRTVAPGGDAIATPDCERPDRSLQAANVTFSSILARTLEGQLIDVTIALPATVDLLSLGGGREVTLPIGFLPPGTYDQLVVVMTQLELVLENGTKVTVTPPGGGWTAIVRVAEPFTVVEGQTTTVTIKFRRELSFGCGGGNGWEFHPEFHCDNDQDDD
jgi:hypothetical protein